MSLFNYLKHYRLGPNHEVELFPVESDADLIEWAREVWGDESGKGRRVAFTEVAPGIAVSTVFLGLDHRYGGSGPPIVFETMVFDDYGAGDCYRYATWDDAVTGHEAVVARIKASKSAAKRVTGKLAPNTGATEKRFHGPENGLNGASLEGWEPRREKAVS